MTNQTRSRQTPILHLMRHGQGYHAITENGQNLRDPRLTPLGEDQCRRLCKTFDRHGEIEMLFASPLRRTLQTCHLTFAPCIERGLKITALPDAVEAFDDPADTGTERSILVEEFPETVNFDLVDEHWYRHEGQRGVEPAVVSNRAKGLRNWLRDQPADEIVLVAHGMFNHYLLNEVDEEGTQTTPWWSETELRTYEFASIEDPEAKMVETADSLHRRKK